jgi:tetratricopeptide (TPR) repeat protein
LLDDFTVERELGEGGMGKVYLVRSRSSGRPFAVKRTKFRDETSRRNFLAELQAWIDLPEHPHLAACRFFRTIGSEVVIFGEYVDGGSLAAWIRDRRLLTREQILDVAIQFAWGLHVAHEAGLVHQDAKPGNVLLTPDGVVKVADFGLARARARAGEEQPPGRHSLVVSWGGMTPAYCSPEQAAGRRLGRRTDVWSWGISVLEMFTGDVTWPLGADAPAALDAHVASGPSDLRLPAMPTAVADVLRRCFRQDPGERWASLADVAGALCRVYVETVGRPYPRPVPTFPHPHHRANVVHDRWTPFGGTRPDPREWLVRAFREAGRDPAEAEALLPARTGTRAAQAVADLAAYEEAGQIFERLITGGRKDLEAPFAELCLHKAVTHRSADDVPGALALYGRSIEVCERLVLLEGRKEFAARLAAAYEGKAEALRDRGDYLQATALYDRVRALAGPELVQQAARAILGKAGVLAEHGEARQAAGLYDEAIALLENRLEEDGRDGAHALARAYMGKARVAGDLGDSRAAVDLCDRAVTLYRRPESREGRRDLATDLAGTLANKARAVRDLGDPRAAVRLYNRALLLYQRLVEQEGRRELADEYAEACACKAAALGEAGDLRRAARLYDRAVVLFERLVHVEGRSERTADLARAYLGKAGTLLDQGGRRAALPLYDQALGMLERLVNEEGRRERVPELIEGYLGKANALAALGDRTEAVLLFDRAIALIDQRVSAEGRAEWVHLLAAAHFRKARAVVGLGELAAALPLYDQAIRHWQRLVEQAGRRQYLRDLAKAKAVRAALLLRLGKLEDAALEAREAVALLQAEIARSGRPDLRKTLKWAANALRKVL